VGRGTGTLELVRRLRLSHPRLEITAGGGVRGVDDLRQLAEAGCDAALVASALHDGRITAKDVGQALAWPTPAGL
jgi:phosphoribosylformimino-5-aminoimidazole carboxamide ribotide isomerase